MQRTHEADPGLEVTQARVPLWGNPQKSVEVERGATAGATIGVNVFNRDGSLFAPQAAATPAAPGLTVTLWRLIQEIPANVSGLAAVTTDGWFRKDGAAIAAREIADTDLPLLPDSGVGASLVKITRDQYGRVEGTEAAALDDLSDVNAPSPSVGEALVWTGAAYEPQAVATAQTFNRIDAAGDIRVAADGSLRITD